MNEMMVNAHGVEKKVALMVRGVKRVGKGIGVVIVIILVRRGEGRRGGGWGQSRLLVDNSAFESESSCLPLT